MFDTTPAARSSDRLTNSIEKKAIRTLATSDGTSTSEKGCTEQTPGCFLGRKQQERHFLGTEAMAHQPHIQHRACGAGDAASPRSTSAGLLVLAGVCWLGGFRMRSDPLPCP